jgi:hypothetical protein
MNFLGERKLAYQSSSNRRRHDPPLPVLRHAAAEICL